MRYALVIVLLSLVIALGLRMLPAPFEDPLGSEDFHHPAGFSSSMDSSFRAFGSAAYELMRGLAAEFTTPSLARLHHESPAQASPR